MQFDELLIKLAADKHLEFQEANANQGEHCVPKPGFYNVNVLSFHYF